MRAVEGHPVGHHRGLVSRVPVVFAVTMALASAGCSDCPPYPCPERLNVSNWCGYSDRCTVGTEPADCYAGGCVLPNHETLAVPIAELTDQLASRQELLLTLMNRTPEFLKPMDLVASLDGVSGEQLVTEAMHIEAPFAWSPFPTSPALIELRFDLSEDVSLLEADIMIEFYSYDCEQEHPFFFRCPR